MKIIKILKQRDLTCLNMLILMIILLSLSACRSEVYPQFDQTIDILLPYTVDYQNIKLAENESEDTFKYLTKAFTKETGIACHLVKIRSNTLDDYNKKRLKLLLSDDAPELIVSVPNDPYWYQYFEALENESVDLSRVVTNYDDIIDAFKYDFAVPVAMHKFALVERLPKNAEKAYQLQLPLVLSSKELKPYYEDWAAQPEVLLTLRELMHYISTTFNHLIEKEGQFTVDNNALLLNSVITTSEFLDVFIARENFTPDSLRARLYDYKSPEFKAIVPLLRSDSTPKLLSSATQSYNVLELDGYNKYFEKDQQPIFITDDNQLTTIYLSAYRQKSENVAEVNQFIQYVVSPETQYKMAKQNLMSMVRSPILKSYYLDDINVDYTKVKEAQLKARHDFINALCTKDAKVSCRLQRLNIEIQKKILNWAIDYSYEEKSEEQVKAEIEKYLQQLNLAEQE